MLGATSSSRPVGLVERVELAEHLATPRKPSTPPTSAPVTREPTAAVDAGRRALLLGELVDDRRRAAVAKRVGVGLHPAGPVDDQHRRGVRRAATSPVNSRTSPVERLASVAELRDDGVRLGPGDARGRRRRAGSRRVTARSQSTMSDALMRRPTDSPYRAVATGEGGGGVVEGVAGGHGLRAARPGRRSATNTIDVPSWSVAMPASALVPGQRAGLGPDRPAGRPEWRPSNRYASDPVNPATGSPVSTGRSSGWSSAAGRPQHGEQGVRGQPVVTRQPAAVVPRAAPPTGTPSSVRAWRTPATPPANDPWPDGGQRRPGGRAPRPPRCR